MSESRHQSEQAFHSFLRRRGRFTGARNGPSPPTGGREWASARPAGLQGRTPSRQSIRARRSAIFLLFGVLLPGTFLATRVASAEPPVSRPTIERTMVLEARAALRRGQAARFARLSNALRDHPLHPWLRYLEFRRRFGGTTNRRSRNSSRPSPTHRWPTPSGASGSTASPASTAGRGSWRSTRRSHQAGARPGASASTRERSSRRGTTPPDSRPRPGSGAFPVRSTRPATPRSRSGREREAVHRSISGIGSRSPSSAATAVSPPTSPGCSNAGPSHRRTLGPGLSPPGPDRRPGGRVRREPQWEQPVATAIASMARRTPDAAARALGGRLAGTGLHSGEAGRLRVLAHRTRVRAGPSHPRSHRVD